MALSIVLLVSSGARAGTQLPFSRPVALEPNISFWVKVFTEYSERDFVVHDRDQIWRVYQVFHLPGSGTPTREEVDWVHAYMRAKYADMLNRLAAGCQPASYEERDVAALFKGEPLAAYALAADNLRIQQGLGERFKEGLLRSRYYYPTMERIFRTFGVPPELVTLASVESGFYSGARSSAGAVGIWQFTRGTGRQYLRITRRNDERLNPTLETQAAARFLRYNYDVLGDWPLAITAYNYGTAGMARAAAENGHDYERVFERYRGPRFGFAARNYYPEFLAALQVHRYEDKYFPGIASESAPPPKVVRVLAPARRSRHSSLRRVSSRGQHRRVVSHGT